MINLCPFFKRGTEGMCNFLRRVKEYPPRLFEPPLRRRGLFYSPLERGLRGVLL